MKNLYQLSDELVSLIKTQFNFTNDSRKINQVAMMHIDKIMLTESKKYRYPKKYQTALHQVFYTTKKQLEENHIIFGYWHDGIFYTTKTTSKHKKTRELYQILGNRELIRLLKCGLYYESNLSPYFIN